MFLGTPFLSRHLYRHCSVPSVPGIDDGSGTGFGLGVRQSKERTDPPTMRAIEPDELAATFDDDVFHYGAV